MCPNPAVADKRRSLLDGSGREVVSFPFQERWRCLRLSELWGLSLFYGMGLLAKCRVAGTKRQKVGAPRERALPPFTFYSPLIFRTSMLGILFSQHHLASHVVEDGVQVGHYGNVDVLVRGKVAFELGEVDIDDEPLLVG